MPTVNDILTIIKDQSLVGAGDSADDTRIMRYLNLLYKEVYRKTAKAYPTLLLSTESVVITSGAGALINAPHSVESVRDTGNNSNKLTPKSLLDLEDRNPKLDDTGNPNSYYMTSTTLFNTYPINTTTLSVRTIPRPTELATGGAENTILIPPEFHDVLVWGTLVLMAVDERDKATGVEINTFQSKYELARNDFYDWLENEQVATKSGTVAVLSG